MNIISTMIVATSLGLSGAALAECPSQLTADNMHECIMMEGSGDLSYQQWAPEFYKELNPGKAAAITAAYKAEGLNNTENKNMPSISVSSTHSTLQP